MTPGSQTHDHRTTLSHVTLLLKNTLWLPTAHQVQYKLLQAPLWASLHLPTQHYPLLPALLPPVLQLNHASCCLPRSALSVCHFRLLTPTLCQGCPLPKPSCAHPSRPSSGVTTSRKTLPCFLPRQPGASLSLLNPASFFLPLLCGPRHSLPPFAGAQHLVCAPPVDSVMQEPAWWRAVRPLLRCPGLCTLPEPRLQVTHQSLL